jgi:hypothetical protein
MDTFMNIGLIECGKASSRLADSGSLDGYHLKKVLVKGNIPEGWAELQYPQAEIVADMRSIVEDEGIDLIIISAPERHGLELAGAALQAGKHVRIM